MSIEASSVVEHFRERVKRLAIYDPLYRLKRKGKKDDEGKEIPYYELGLLTLLFFFEKMVMRQKNSGVKELTAFLYEVSNKRISLSLEAYEVLAREIIDVFRPSSGKRNHMLFYNWETQAEEVVYYTILKASRSDFKQGTQYYTLDEDGLELIFCSREYFSEFQISISQLLLRKQLEKGEFIGALRQVDEMNLAVGSLRERLIKIKQEVSRNIISEETYKRYKGLLDDIHNRLERENEEFNELRDFVRQTKGGLKYQIEGEKEKKAYELILKIDTGLEDVHYEHRRLLEESVRLRTHALDAAQQALYFIGIDSFNFEQDITQYILGKPLPLSVSKTLVDPFLELQQDKVWNPLTLFEKQRMEKNGEEEKSKAYAEMAIDAEAQRENEQVKAYFKEVMVKVIQMLGGRNHITLKEICEQLKESKNSLIHQKIFYNFWIILHQKSPIELEALEEESLLYGVKESLSGITNWIEVVEQEEVLEPVERFKIKNMKIDLKRKER